MTAKTLKNIPSFSTKGIVLAAIETTIGTPPTGFPYGNNDGRAYVIEAYEPKITNNYEKISRNKFDTTLTRHKDYVGIRDSELTFKMPLKGYGIKGAIPKISPLLQSCGMSETQNLDVTTPANNYVRYQFLDTYCAMKTCSIAIFIDGKVFLGSGCRGQFNINVQSGQPVFIDFTFKGKFNQMEFSDFPKYLIRDVITPALANLNDSFRLSVELKPTTTYADGWNVHEFSLSCDLGLKRRDNINISNGFSEFIPTSRNITGKLEMEIPKGCILTTSAECATGVLVVSVIDATPLVSGTTYIIQVESTGEIMTGAYATSTTLALQRNTDVDVTIPAGDKLHVIGVLLGSDYKTLINNSGNPYTANESQLQIDDYTSAGHGIEVGDWLLSGGLSPNNKTIEILRVIDMDPPGANNSIHVLRNAFTGYYNNSERNLNYSSANAVIDNAVLWRAKIFRNFQADIINDETFKFEYGFGASGLTPHGDGSHNSYNVSSTGYSSSATTIVVDTVSSGYLSSAGDYWFNPRTGELMLVTNTSQSPSYTVQRGVNNIQANILRGDYFWIFTDTKLAGVKELYSGKIEMTGFFRIQQDSIVDKDGLSNVSLDLQFTGSTTDNEMNPRTELIIDFL